MILLSHASLGQDTLLPPSSDAHTSGPQETKLICWCDREAQFPGGEEAFKGYLKNYLRLEALQGVESHSSHTFYVDFTVDEEGKIRDVDVRMLNDENAVQWIEYVFETMPRWEPRLYEERIYLPTRVRVPITAIVGDPRYFN
ncbi:MAG: hypothetical protein ACFHU9_02495 [Fluviicola sp.]